MTVSEKVLIQSMAAAIKEGRLTLEQVPNKHKEAVQALVVQK